MGEGAIVKRGTIEVSYIIRDFSNDEDSMFDWCGPDGETSDDWFETVQEAEDDVKRYYRG